MLNWEMEFKKWCPAFKLLTYFGSAKERKTKRHGWSKPNAFHICITSYTLVLQVSWHALCTAHARIKIACFGCTAHACIKVACCGDTDMNKYQLGLVWSDVM
jgi:SNF2 family DNA or RNA helicase